ncbi:uncharacterized protein LOC121684466 [Alosa sapidissima]|uniref:uncharacterized protein LOC121684466 n=1 Tax=Alosa sapidissima TaxID=34773 RepID=UPI001C083E18|nr:uncharacterized protein LOC121684466 [Alosa sapidissima]XP_041920457.1 uncharacterized protein LOC121684466 [Alosa sapidissima]XP_041920458.1 uncharacterized protein LOC121684466 [Alosa sapidissima]XP_041920459.1 uncharacterized protein LOC121684466 [Alosa sapidissima]XP_041920460.1 uncharacterized protein LOC121684466 [Alosa sapidissima]XP_041920461.1 uncharacterized protein LOC121684466 [Alosa sapidissima]XP_041920462.1 uncharacterized protein LOC121684466 [Alosa sapidissima]XP_04192046
MTELVRQMGCQIGDQIAASLSSSRQDTPRTDNTQCSAPDWSKMNVVFRSDIKEPPTFRGDSSDRYTAREWQESMQVYLNKKGYSTAEQGQEILDKLMDRARDVVRTCIRNNPLINIQRDPQVIFSILRQHFGEAISSTTPMRDFYETLPKQSERSLDYWIRLNKAIDLADESLQRQGRRVEDASHEVTMMFIRHCPEPGLYTAFRSKPLEGWSATEVQALIESHHKDRQSARMDRLQSNAKSDEWTPDMCCMTQQQAKNSNQLNGFDPGLLGKAVSLLEQMLSAQHLSPVRTRTFSPTPTPVAGSTGPCRICHAPDHSTKAHCFKEGLCFKCHKAGHRGFEKASKTEYKAHRNRFRTRFKLDSPHREGGSVGIRNAENPPNDSVRVLVTSTDYSQQGTDSLSEESNSKPSVQDKTLKSNFSATL